MAGVGDRIKKLRCDQGLTQRELSSPGVSYAYISRIERGEREPSVKALRQIASRLGTTVEYLETGRKAILTLMLSELSPWLEPAGINFNKLNHTEILKLGGYVREAMKRCPGENPFKVAAEILSKDISNSKSPDHLFADRA